MVILGVGEADEARRWVLHHLGMVSLAGGHWGRENTKWTGGGEQNPPLAIAGRCCQLCLGSVGGPQGGGEGGRQLASFLSEASPVAPSSLSPFCPKVQDI